MTCHGRYIMKLQRLCFSVTQLLSSFRFELDLLAEATAVTQKGNTKVKSIIKYYK